MSGSHYSFLCDAFKDNLFKGFSCLQQQQEFVDLTLAADGHLVKVHKNVIALASPYLREILQSTSSTHPVIFLNNVSHKVLSYLLEYIYQGEVDVPGDCIQSFIQVAKSLHITGINKVVDTKQCCSSIDTEEQVQKELFTVPLEQPSEKQPNNFAAHITISSDHNFEVQQYPTDYKLPAISMTKTLADMPDVDFHGDDLNNPQNVLLEVDCNSIQNNLSILTENEHPNPHASDRNVSSSEVSTEVPMLDLSQPINLDKESTEALKIISQYSVSNRGCVQIIVNRYIYHTHHISLGGRKHRWRCYDYRKLHCPAYIDSLDGVIVLRKGIHNHKFHDDIIYKKHNKGLIFTSIEKAKQAYYLPIGTLKERAKQTSDVPRNPVVGSEDVESCIKYSVIET